VLRAGEGQLQSQQPDLTPRRFTLHSQDFQVPESTDASDDAITFGAPADEAAAVPSEPLFTHALLSRAGCEPGFRKTNQDAAFMASCWAPAGGSTLLGVLDGHGPQGHLVAAYLKDSFVTFLAAQAQAMKRGEASSALRAAFGACEAGLECEGSKIDIDFSGSTLVAALLDGPHADGSGLVTCAWTGDSRCVVGRRPEGDAPGPLAALALTVDHKPDTPAEAARIRAAGGRVEQLVDERGQRVGPHRVWLKTAWTPGLAMSRALGDAVAHTAGVSSTPDVTVHPLCARDELIILATDGIWEFITNEEAVTMAAAAPNPAAACAALAAEAAARWVKEEDGVCDDITVLVLFLGAGKQADA